MNPQKANLKIIIATELGADLEDKYEGSLKASHETAGAADALAQVAKKVPQDLVARLTKEVEEGGVKTEGICVRDGLTAHEVEKLITRWLTRAGDYLEHLSVVERQKAVALGGEADGIKASMGIISDTRKKEQEKLQNFLAAAQSSDETAVATAPVPRTAAEAARAAHGSLEDRRAQAKAEKVAKSSKKVPKKKAVRKKVSVKKIKAN